MLAFGCVHKSSTKRHQSEQDPTSQVMIQTPFSPLWKFTIPHLWTYMARECRKLKCSSDLSKFTTFLPAARKERVKLFTFSSKQAGTENVCKIQGARITMNCYRSIPLGLSDTLPYYGFINYKCKD